MILKNDWKITQDFNFVYGLYYFMIAATEFKLRGYGKGYFKHLNLI